MAISKAFVEFQSNDIDAVCNAVAALRDGEWINLEPFIDQAALDDLRARTPNPLVRMFTKAGAPIPLGTIMRTAHGYSIGLEHSHAARTIPFLRDNGVDTPRAWKIKQDHARRGIVLEVAADTPPADVVRWILRAARFVGSVAVGDSWTALVCTRP